MAASPVRWITRILLVAILIGLVWIGYRSHLRSQPGYHWDRAQSALAVDNSSAAKIHLHNLIQRFPSDPRGHQAMAELMLTENKLPVTADGYAAHPGALNLLLEAGKLRETDLDLQKLLVTANLRAGRVSDAAVAAQRVLKEEPKHADSLFVRALRSTENRDGAAALKLLDQLPAESQQSFRVLGLRARALQQQDPKHPKLQEHLEAIVARAATLIAEEAKKLPIDELQTITRLLPAAVASAADVESAYRRANVALGLAERLPPAPAFARMMAEISATLNAKYPALALGPEAEQLRTQFRDGLAKVLPSDKPDGDKKPTDLLVAHEAALLQFSKGEFAAASQLLEQTIKQHQSLKRSRPEDVQSLHLLAARSLLAQRRHREAKAHLTALAEDRRTSGLAQLLLGATASAEGRHQDALDHYLRSERELGASPLLLLAVAQSHLALAEWEQALPRLAALHGVLASDNAELQAWLKQNQLSEPQLHLQEARALFALKRPQDAKTHLEALSNTPLAPQAILLEAEYLTATAKDYAAAEALLASANEKYPTHTGVVARRAALLAWQKKSSEHAAVVTAASAAAPDDLPMQLLVAREWLRVGDHEKALATLAALEAKHPDVVPLQLLKADALHVAGKTDEAKAVLAGAQKQAEDGALGGVLGAVIAMRGNDPQSAVAALKANDDIGPDNLYVRYLEGELAASAGDFSTAIAAFGEAVRVTSLRRRAGPLLIFCITRLAQKEGAAAAEAALVPLMTAHPDEPFVLMASSDVLTMQNKFDDALKQLDRLEVLEKKSPLPAHLKAIVLIRANDRVVALAEAKRALDLQPRYFPVIPLIAQLQFDAKAYEDSLKTINAGLAQLPTAWTLALLKCEVLWALDRKPDAIEEAKAVVATFPEVVEARRSLVTLQARLRDDAAYAQALQSCQEARTKFASDASLAIQEIVLLQLVGKSEESDTKAGAFIGQPVDVTKTILVVQSLTQAKQFEPARQWAQLAMAGAKPNEVAALHHVLGMSAMVEHAATANTANLEVARDHFAAVLKTHPQDVLSANNLAWLLAVDFNQPAQAVEVVDRSLTAIPIEKLPVTFIDTMAVVYRKAQEYTKAASLLEKAHELHPTADLLTFHLGMTLGNVERYREAKQLLQSALQGKLTSEQQAEAQQELERVTKLESAAAAKKSLEQAAATKAKTKPKVAGSR